jgi:hypothetical protein
MTFAAGELPSAPPCQETSAASQTTVALSSEFSLWALGIAARDELGNLGPLSNLKCVDLGVEATQDEESGCGCRFVGLATPGSEGALGWLAAAAWLLVRRRRGHVAGPNTR